jgi:hypothetical protein
MTPGAPPIRETESGRGIGDSPYSPLYKADISDNGQQEQRQIGERGFFFAFPASVPDGEVDERPLGNDEKEEPYQEDERKNAVHLFGKSAALAARLH